MYINERKNEVSKNPKAKWILLTDNFQNNKIFKLPGYEHEHVNEDVLIYCIEKDKEYNAEFTLVIQSNFEKYLTNDKRIRLQASNLPAPMEYYETGDKENDGYYLFIITPLVEEVVIFGKVVSGEKTIYLLANDGCIEFDFIEFFY